MGIGKEKANLPSGTSRAYTAAGQVFLSSADSFYEKELRTTRGRFRHESPDLFRWHHTRSTRCEPIHRCLASGGSEGGGAASAASPAASSAAEGCGDAVLVYQGAGISGREPDPDLVGVGCADTDGLDRPGNVIHRGYFGGRARYSTRHFGCSLSSFPVAIRLWL